MKPINQNILALLAVILITVGGAYASPLAVRKIKSIVYKEYRAKVVDGKVLKGDALKRSGLRYASSEYESGFVEAFYNRKGKPTEKRFYPDPLSDKDSVNIVKYTYDNKGRLLKRVGDSGFAEALMEFRYDPKGNISYERRESNGSMGSTEETFYYYSDKGLLDSCVIKHSCAGNSTAVFSYEYQPNGKMKMKKKTKPSYSEVSFYDIDGVLTATESISGNDSTTFSRTLYAADGGMTKILDRTGRVMEEFARYGDLRHGELLSVSRLYPRDSSVRWTETLYNSKDDLLSVYSFRRTNKGVELHSAELYVYKYDRYGNWTERIIYSNEKAWTITERDITYY